LRDTRQDLRQQACPTLILADEQDNGVMGRQLRPEGGQQQQQLFLNRTECGQQLQQQVLLRQSGGQPLMHTPQLDGDQLQRWESGQPLLHAPRLNGDQLPRFESGQPMLPQLECGQPQLRPEGGRQLPSFRDPRDFGQALEDPKRKHQALVEINRSLLDAYYVFKQGAPLKQYIMSKKKLLRTCYTLSEVIASCFFFVFFCTRSYAMF
jgi:hypothetical protein